MFRSILDFLRSTFQQGNPDTPANSNSEISGSTQSVPSGDECDVTGKTRKSLPNNPILELLFDRKGLPKTKITQNNLDVFFSKYVVPSKALLGTEAQKRNYDPAQADSRNILLHLWNNHMDGYTPFGDVAFLRDTECNYIHLPLIHQIYKYFDPKNDISTSTTRRRHINVCTQDYKFLQMALLYEVLPYVGQRLQNAITAEDLKIKIKKTFDRFQKKMRCFNNSNSLYDTGIFALGSMNNAVFGSAFGIASDGTVFYPTFQFGRANNGKDVNAVQLLEATFRALINNRPLETIQQEFDDDQKYLEYGGTGLPSANAKIDLFCAGVEATKTVRQIVALQHPLMYSDNEFSNKIAEQSNDYFNPKRVMAFLRDHQNG